MSDSVILPAFCKKVKQLFGFCMVLLMAMACGFRGSTAETMSSPSVSTFVEEGGNEEVGSEGAGAGEFGGFVSFIEQKMESDCIAGVAAAIVRGDEVVFAQGFGMRDMEEELPVTPETLFHIASTHKSMTAMMIATLVDEGLFGWDTPVVEIYPDFALSDPLATEEVTMRHLLSMRGGIPDDAEDDFDPYSSTAANMFDVVAESDLLGQPGEVFDYSNLSVAISGYLGALASSGQLATLYDDYATLLSEQVLSPIGMESATIYYSQAQANPNYANSYICQNNQPTLAETEDFDGDPLAPAGSLKANVVEMALYISTQLGRGVAPNGTQVVSEQNLSATWQPYLENYGMGWEVTDYNAIEIVMHTGSYDNFESVIGFMPALDTGFVVLTNAETGGELTSQAPFVLLDLLSEREGKILLPIVVAQ